MANQSDVEAALDNMFKFPTYYVRMLDESPQQLVCIGEGILEGLADGDNVPESLMLASDNAVCELQYAFAYDLSKVLNGKSNQTNKENQKLIIILFSIQFTFI